MRALLVFANIFYLDVSGFEAPPQPRPGIADRIRHELGLTLRSVPY